MSTPLPDFDAEPVRRPSRKRWSVELAIVGVGVFLFSLVCCCYLPAVFWSLPDEASPWAAIREELRDKPPPNGSQVGEVGPFWVVDFHGRSVGVQEHLPSDLVATDSDEEFAVVIVRKDSEDVDEYIGRRQGLLSEVERDVKVVREVFDVRVFTWPEKLPIAHKQFKAELPDRIEPISGNPTYRLTIDPKEIANWLQNK